MATSAITFPANGTSSLTVNARQAFTVLLTVTNGGTVPVNVLAIVPRIYQGTNVQTPSFSGNPTIPATPVSVPASGTLTFIWTDVMLGPDLSNGLANDLSGTNFSIDAVVVMSDATINTATAGTLTCNARTF